MRHVYLSPHPDDVVLSCGGMIAQQAEAGEPITVITFFAGDPPDDLSPFAQSLHERWEESLGSSAVSIPAMRRLEDRAALDSIDHSIELVHYPLPDCIYRLDPHLHTPLYDSEEDLFGRVSLYDQAVQELKRFAVPANSTLYVPLAVGNHVDHQIVREAAEGWETETMLYYDDYPYATDPEAVEAALDGHQWETTTPPLTEEALLAKVKAAAHYTSQISTFWGSLEEMARDVSGYTERLRKKITD